MKFRKIAVTKSADAGSRDELRELAEVLSLWRSAMHHVAARQAEHPRPVEVRPAHRFRLRLILAPALSAAAAAGILVPVYSHLHHQQESAAPAAAAVVQQTGLTRASVDDTALMNRIDGELSEDVPDALRPLADLSVQATNTTSPTENKNATQE